MGKGNFPLYAFNRGEVSRRALGRVDLDRMRLSAEEQVNWLPEPLGPMTLRPGLQYLGATRSNNEALFIPFVFGNSDTAALELTGNTGATGLMRVWIGDALVSRVAVGTSVNQGAFAAQGNWTTATDPISISENTTTISGGKLRLAAAAKGSVAFAKQTVIVPSGARNKVHALRIVVDRGPVLFKAGSSNGADNYITTTDLAEGTHSLAFTPTGGNVFIYFETNTANEKRVDSCEVEASGTFSLPTPWPEDDLPYVRYAQSGDIVFVACKGIHPYKIERRSATSWSIVKYLSRNGPLQSGAGADIKLTPGAMYGNTTLTAQRPYFTEGHVGCLFRLFTPGQTRKAVIAGDDEYAGPIRITGVETESERESPRAFSYQISGSWEGAIDRQRSLEEGDLGLGFVSNGDPHVKNGSKQVADGLNNSISYFRVGFGPGRHKGGAATIEFNSWNGRSLDTGGGAGYCRVTAFTSSRVVSIEIQEPFTSLNATADWQEGEWSDRNGYPSSVAFHDGRLWWAGADKIWGSVSDDFDNFDIEKEGDAGPINRSVGFGPVDNINWMLPLGRLIIGRDGAETSLRSSSLDEPITPTSFTLKDCSTKGTARLAAVKADADGIFISKSLKKAYELTFSGQAADYAARDLTRLHPDIAGDGFVRVCVQMQPDITIHFVKSDGTVAVLLYDKADEVEAWWRVETDGLIEDAFVLPGTIEDSVYYVVKRTINGGTVRYLEKFARRDQCTGLAEARLADSHIVDTGGDVTITGLSHLNGKTVVAWGWNNGGTSGVDLGAYTVSNGKIVVGAAYNNVCVGLGYTATFKSAKLAYAADRGSALNQKKRVDHVGLILYNTHYQGLEYGQRSDVLDELPLVSDGTDIAANTVHEEFDEQPIEIPGEWDTDSRLYLKAAAPRPCTVAGVTIGLETNG